MKKTITLEGFIHAKPADKYNLPEHIRDGWHFTFWGREDMSASGFIKVCPVAVTFNIPKDFNGNGKMVEILQKEKVKILAEMTKHVTDIDRQINELLAIEA